MADDGVLVIPAEVRPGRRLYPLPAKQLLVVTMGRGVVVSCAPDWVEPLRAMLGDRERDAVFAATTIAELAPFVAAAGEELRGPAVSYACAPESFRRPAIPPGIAIEVVEGTEVHDLYWHPGSRARPLLSPRSSPAGRRRRGGSPRGTDRGRRPG